MRVDAQFITIGLAFLMVLIGLLFNRSAITELSASLGARLDDMNTHNSCRFQDLSKRMDDTRDLLRAEMSKNQSELLAKFAELDQRVSRLEQQRFIQ